MSLLAALPLMALGVTGARAAEGGPCDARIEHAIVAAIEARMGSAVHAEVARLEGARVECDEAAIVATPDPSGRVGRLVRFTLSATSPAGSRAGARIGEASAVVAVAGAFVRLRRSVPRGRILGELDVEMADVDLHDVPFRPLPTMAGAIGARATRDLGPGDLATEAALVSVPAVRSGDPVRVVMRTTGVEAVVAGVALETGRAGQIVRVSNPNSHRAFRARVLGAGEVEVVYER